MDQIKKAIVPIAGLATRFLPLSKALPKEFLPLVDKPVIQYIIEEIKDSGINEVIFVIRPKGKEVLNYFKKSPKLEKMLKERNNGFLKDVKELAEIFKNITFSTVIQKDALGDGHAILQAKKAINQESVAVLFVDDIINSEIPCTLQLIQIFKTCQKPVVALMRMKKEELHRYGVVVVDKIADRVYKIKKIIEKPPPGKAPSDLVIIGRYIHTPEVFDYLKAAKPGLKGEIIAAEVLNKMLEDGKTIYGYEFKGKRLDCGDKISWLKSFFYCALQHPEFKDDLKKFLKDEKI